MKTKTIFKAESNAENILVVAFLGLAIYLKVQLIIFIIDCFQTNDIQTSIASLF